MRRTGYEELTDPENEEFLGTYTYRGWRGLAVAEVRARFYSVDPDDPHFVEMPHPAESLIHVARQTSGSILGQHRRDLKDAIVGEVVRDTGVSVPVTEGQPAEAQAAPKRRGL